MEMTDLKYLLPSAGLMAVGGFVLAFFGANNFIRWMRRQHQRFDVALNQQLLLEIDPKLAIGATIFGMVAVGVAGYALMASIIGFIMGATITYFVPFFFISWQENKRRARLEAQLVDGIVALASGVRAGLNLVQSMELLVVNSEGPIKQEFAQLLREYSMGLDLNQCMRNTSDRIGLPNYRLLFTAIEMHRKRGGDTGESLDRIAESIREIQRLEGKLDAVTSQGRTQARMMAGAAIVLIFIYWIIDPEGVNLMLTEPKGRVFLLIAFATIGVGFYWINRIMDVDI